MTGQVTLSETMLITANEAGGDALDAGLGTLVRERARMVYQIAYSVLRNHHDAEDASQEVFLRVWKYRDKLSGVDDPKAWVASIAWRVAVDRGAARGKREGISLDDAAHTALRDALRSRTGDAESAASQRQMQAWLEAAIPTLPSDLRAALLLSTVEGLNSTEIAAVLKISEGAVRTRLFRARALLKEKLAKSLGTKA